MVIQQLQLENQGIIAELQKKDDENRQLAQIAQDFERKMRKAQSSVKTTNKSKAALRESEREIHKMRKDMLELRDQNKQLNARVQELKES